MQVTAVIVTLCSVVALGYACCTPDQWEGAEASIGGWATKKRHGLLKEYIKVSYDATNNRTAAFLDYVNGDFSNKYQIVTRYDEGVGKLYVVDLKKDKCWTKELTRPFRKACIPDSAKSMGEYYLGLEGGFKVSGFEVKGKSFQVFVSVQLLDNNQCVPVGETVTGSLRKADFVQNVGFINVTPGIKNETVFDIPKACEKMEDFSLAEELSREHYIMAV
ncbi:ependymin-related protein 1-like [Physella acuta]|uniref:ependymin-related protein 1-like n=1 Tax=Physella acuta TaxID=109671 RepID=UPI0027DD9013|nr:ependymin-related protein 1-like [Physella acuta]